MSKNAFQTTHVQNLNFLSSYIKSVDSSLSQLHQIVGAELKSLDASLIKGTPHPRKYLPRPKTPASFEQLLYKSLLSGGLSGTGLSTSSSTYRTSSSQIWAQIAAGVSKAMGRSL